jgi:hypothetical protein
MTLSSLNLTAFATQASATHQAETMGSAPTSRPTPNAAVVCSDFSTRLPDNKLFQERASRASGENLLAPW